jgi:uncharacterized membrane protein
VGVGRAWRGWRRRLDAAVAATPDTRDRYVDFLRALSLAVVVLWHWALSLLRWTGERWVMPNPIYAVPGSWLATWLLQVVTVFFIVGGYANAAAWWSARRAGRGWRGYLAVRLRRLLLPLAVFLAVWVAVEVVAHLAIPGYPGVLRYAPMVFTPLWFIAAYLWVVVLTPVTATLHARARWPTVTAMAAAVAACDLLRFTAGLTVAGWVNTALVWVLVHQLGYFYRDAAAGTGPGRAAAVAVAGLLLLAGLTSLPAYPPSMVATVGQERSNIFPTTATIAALALLQLGVILLLRRPVSRWLRRPAVWRPVVAANTVILTVFLWHMTALLVVLGVLRALAVNPPAEPTAAWWAQRPFWVAAPALVLLVLVAVFARFENLGRAPAPRRRRDGPDG